MCKLSLSINKLPMNLCPPQKNKQPFVKDFPKQSRFKFSGISLENFSTDLFSRHPSSCPCLGTFSPLFSPPPQNALFCRARGTAQSLQRGNFRTELSAKFGMEIPSRNLRENRSVNLALENFQSWPWEGRVAKRVGRKTSRRTPLPKIKNEKSAQGGSFWHGYPANIRGSFAQIARPKTSVRAFEILENKHLGADVHDPKARTSTTLRDFQKLRSEKFWAEFPFPTKGVLDPPLSGTFSTPFRCHCPVLRYKNPQLSRPAQKFSGGCVLWYVFLLPYVLHPPYHGPSLKSFILPTCVPYLPSFLLTFLPLSICTVSADQIWKVGQHVGWPAPGTLPVSGAICVS